MENVFTVRVRTRTPGQKFQSSRLGWENGTAPIFIFFSKYFESSESVLTFEVSFKETMKLDEAKKQFIEAWGTLGSNWGINRTMAQIHALLMVSPDSMNTDQVMEALEISRGNANMNLRALIDWGLVERKIKLGERIEYFAAEKDIWKVATRIIRERRRREIEPLREVLSGLQNIEDKDSKPAQYAEFTKLVHDIEVFAESTDKIAERLVTADQNWFLGTMMKLMIK